MKQAEFTIAYDLFLECKLRREAIKLVHIVTGTPLERSSYLVNNNFLLTKGMTPGEKIVTLLTKLELRVLKKTNLKEALRQIKKISL